MKAILFIVILAVAVSVRASTIVEVTKYGAKPNSFTDATEFIKKAIASCSKDEKTVLLFQKGRYDFWPDKAEERNYCISI